jgi:pimeloyl-ACP methyl ester carboxylesterase
MATPCPSPRAAASAAPAAAEQAVEEPAEQIIAGPTGVAWTSTSSAERSTRNETRVAAVGDLEAAIDDTVARLTAEPELATVVVGHHQLTVTVGPEEFAEALVQLGREPEAVTLLPAAVRRARDGDLEPLLRRTLAPGPVVGSPGMTYSMLCSAVPTDLEAERAILRDDPGELSQHVVISYLGEICDVWDVPVSCDPADVEVAPEIPTLILTGGLDLVTPPLHGERLHAALPASLLLECRTACTRRCTGSGDADARSSRRSSANPRHPSTPPASVTGRCRPSTSSGARHEGARSG